MSHQSKAAALLLVVSACASAYPSARLGRGTCMATAEALAQVTYQPQPDRPVVIEIGCAGCGEVYVAAAYAWLDRHCSGYVLREHSTVGAVAMADKDTHRVGARRA